MIPRTDSIDPIAVASTTIVLPPEVLFRVSLNCWTSGCSQACFSDPYAMLIVTVALGMTLLNAPHALNNRDNIATGEKSLNFILSAPNCKWDRLSSGLLRLSIYVARPKVSQSIQNISRRDF